MRASRPIIVSIFNDFPLIVSGLAAMFQQDFRIDVVERLSSTSTDVEAAITLFDDFADERPSQTLQKLTRDPHAGKIVLFTWFPDSAFAQSAVQQGATAVLDKSLDAAQLAKALLEIAGEQGAEADPAPLANRQQHWPGKDAGLSAREAEVLCLIAQGHTNDQIAELCDLSINSVKSYIRTAYRKIGVVRRSQAVVWAIQHGLQPSPRPN